MNGELVFTPASLVELLTQIDELKDLNIQLSELGDSITLTVGDSVYQLNTDSATDIKVPPSVVDEVAEVNDETYQDLEASGEVDLSEPVESGILTGAIKSMLLGGLIRLAPKLMK